jgi:hypothetical protein
VYSCSLPRPSQLSEHTSFLSHNLASHSSSRTSKLDIRGSTARYYSRKKRAQENLLLQSASVNMAASGNFHGTELSSLNKQTGAHLQKRECVEKATRNDKEYRTSFAPAIEGIRLFFVTIADRHTNSFSSPAPTVDAQHSSRTRLLFKSKGSREKSSTTHEKMGTTNAMTSNKPICFCLEVASTTLNESSCS